MEDIFQHSLIFASMARHLKGAPLRREYLSGESEKNKKGFNH
jgi:hypothetical protein